METVAAGQAAVVVAEDAEIYGEVVSVQALSGRIYVVVVHSVKGDSYNGRAGASDFGFEVVGIDGSYCSAACDVP